MWWLILLIVNGVLYIASWYHDNIWAMANPKAGSPRWHELHPSVDWARVTELEQDIFGVAYHGPDGTYYPDGH